MDFSEYFPIWDKLTDSQRRQLSGAAELRSVKKGTILHNGALDCLGLLVIRSGQIRVYYSSEDGREVTLYRLLSRDICLLSASCVMPNIQFDTVIEAEKDSEVWIIPSCLYKNLAQESAAMANYSTELMGRSMSEIMWLMEQIMWKSMDKRLAAFLLEEAALDGGPVLKLTHERIANHLGTAREVVTRMLRYFQSEGMVKLTRGTIALTDPEKLRQLGD